jgi:hypothetical protein
LDLSGKTVTLPAASVTAHVTAFDDNQLKEEIALLGFRTAANGSLAKYNLVDQTIDDFQDTSGVDAGSSTNEVRDSSGKYYSGSYVDYPTGGTITTYTDGGTDYRTHTFTADGNFIVSTSGDVDAMLVGAGGGGSNAQSGGGGGGGMITMAAYGVTAQTYAIVIGAGGTGASTQGNAGASTTGFGETATGGGGGGFGASGGGNGANGGGGGDTTSYLGGTGTAPSTVSASATAFGGYDGGDGGPSKGGGGGGLAAVGSNGSPQAGAGGAGKQYNLDGNDYYWGGGGGGAAYNSNAADGGIGGGGGGGTHTSGSAGTGGGSAINSGGNGNATNTSGGDGGVNTGGGGGGGQNTGDGGSGIVQIRYEDTGFFAYNNLTLVSTTTTAQAAPTKGDLVMTYTNGAGTATVNTDIKAYASRDDGTTWTQLTLASQGSTGDHTILSAHDLDISGQPSGTDMRYKITTHNQSVTKQTRIHAVSLGWS